VADVGLQQVTEIRLSKSVTSCLYSVGIICIQINRTLSSIGHSWSFKVILIGVGRNPERAVVVMYNIVDSISEIVTIKLQIRRFRSPTQV